MEDTLTLEEAYALLESLHRREHRHNRATAAFTHGIDIGEFQSGEEQASFEDIQTRAQAALAGKTEEQVRLEMAGMEFESDDD